MCIRDRDNPEEALSDLLTIQPRYDLSLIHICIFNEINVVNLQYKPVPYTDWQPLPSGLNGSVRSVSYTHLLEPQL